ncbi:MAG: flagellar hook-basal body complex protein FliE [Oscillospiraceae bacterium]|nr:flagellar hook-basal body complex protein FliE [Oscillospiraceae bacterium]MCL2278270.1 flagellar hook-basal body complex protein FliE [Oscillospiraceae bacterium]
MNPNPLAPNLMHLFNNTPVLPPSSTARRTGTDDFTGGFANILSAAFENVNATDHADRASMLQLLTGEADDLSGLLIDAQKAELALQLALQIRNKLIDAYTEIMRMQV